MVPPSLFALEIEPKARAFQCVAAFTCHRDSFHAVDGQNSRARGIGSAGGLAEGGVPKFVALVPRRDLKSRTVASSSATRRSSAAMR